MPNFRVCWQGGEEDIEAIDEADAIETAKDYVIFETETIEDDDDDDEDEDDDEDDEGDE
jgi:hypothetical protein